MAAQEQRQRILRSLLMPTKVARKETAGGNVEGFAAIACFKKSSDAFCPCPVCHFSAYKGVTANRRRLAQRT